MKTYKFFPVVNNEVILEDWVNKYSDLPATFDEAIDVAKSFGLENEIIEVRKISEIEYNEKGVN